MSSLPKATFFLTISSFVFLVSGYLINIWLGRYLGPDYYGMYGVIVSLMTIINIIQQSGIPQAVSKFVSEDSARSGSVLRVSLFLQSIVTILISALLFIFASPLASLMNDERLVPYIRLSVLILPVYGIYALYAGYYNGLHDFKKQSLLSTIYAIAKIFTIIGLGLFFHLYGAISGFIFAPLIALLFAFSFPKKSDSYFSYKKLILFSLPLIGFSVLTTLQHSIDLFFIKSLMHDDKAAGYFTASQNIARIPYFGLSAFATVLFPSISASVSQNLVEKTQKIIRESLRYILLLLLPSTFLISAMSEQLVSLLYSSKYLAAAVPLSILIFGYAFLTLFLLLAQVLSGSGEPKTAMVLAGLGALLNAVLSYLLIPHFGLAGAALATTIGGGITCILTGIATYRKFGVLTSPWSALKIFAASFVIYIVSFYIPGSPLFLPVKGIVLGGLYVGVLYLLGEVKEDDKARVLSLLKRKSK